MCCCWRRQASSPGMVAVTVKGPRQGASASVLPAEHLLPPRHSCHAARPPGWRSHSTHLDRLWQFELLALLRPAQDDTPVPTNRAVYLHDTPSATFFVSQYGGFGQDDITVSLKVTPFFRTCCLSPRSPVCSICACRLILFNSAQRSSRCLGTRDLPRAAGRRSLARDTQKVIQILNPRCSDDGGGVDRAGQRARGQADQGGRELCVRPLLHRGLRPAVPPDGCGHARAALPPARSSPLCRARPLCNASRTRRATLSRQ